MRSYIFVLKWWYHRTSQIDLVLTPIRPGVGGTKCLDPFHIGISQFLQQQHYLQISFLRYMLHVWWQLKKVQTPKSYLFAPFFGPDNPIFGGKENRKLHVSKKLYRDKLGQSQSQSQTPLSSAFLVQKDFRLKIKIIKFWIKKKF